MHHESLNGQLLKPILEASYLTAENAWRYRAILRYFYIQHERLRHYLLPEEVYEHLKASQYFANYTEEQLQQDLNQLVNWGNLIPRQDTGRVSTIQSLSAGVFAISVPLILLKLNGWYRIWRIWWGLCAVLWRERCLSAFWRRCCA